MSRIACIAISWRQSSSWLVPVVLVPVVLVATFGCAQQQPSRPFRSVELCAEREPIPPDEQPAQTFSLADAPIVADADRRLPSHNGGCSGDGAPRFELEIEAPDGTHAFVSVALVDADGSSAPDIAIPGDHVSVDVDFHFDFTNHGSALLRDPADDGVIFAAEQLGSTEAHALGPVDVSLGAVSGAILVNDCGDVTPHELAFSADNSANNGVSIASGASDTLVIDGVELEATNLETTTVGPVHGPACPVDGGSSPGATWMALRR